MYGYGYRYNSGLVVGAGGGAPFVNTYSLSLDGVGDYVDTNSTKFSGASEFSISMWANFSAFSGNNPIVSNWFTGVTNYIIRYSSTKLQFYISTTGGVAKVTEYTFTPTLGIWYNIICVYNGSNISIYINGTQQGTPTAITGTVLVNTNNCLIGERGTEHFNGLVDEVSYFDRFLTPTEITDISTTPTDLTDLNPIAWYRNGDNGSYKSPQWLIPNNSNKDKVSNYTFQLDGINDYIDCGDSDVFSFGDGATDSAFSVSTWFKMSSFNTNNVVFSKDSGLPSREYAIGFFGASKKLRFYIKNQGGNNQQSIDSTTLFTTDTWYNVICTYDGSGGSNAADGMNIYVNGVLETPTSIIKGTYVAMGNTTAPVNIGRYGAAASPLPATVDEVSVYDSELLQADVDSIYGVGEPTAISGAIAHWRMGENATLLTDWTIPDEVGSNNGASVNMNFLDRIGEAPNSTGNALSFNMDSGDRLEDTP